MLAVWPASIVMEDAERLVIPLPAYPPAPQPEITNAAVSSIASNNSAPVIPSGR
jgi:hypothetical protein